MKYKMLGLLVFGIVGWVAKKLYKSNRETDALIRKGADLEDEMHEIEETAQFNLDTIEGSIEMARKCGVPEDEILHNLDEVDAFFMG